MPLDQALHRLGTALDQVEVALSRRLESELGLEPLETELSVMRDDRSRLAVELDAALAHSAAMERALAEVSQRLDRAMKSVRAALEADVSAALQGDRD